MRERVRSVAVVAVVLLAACSSDDDGGAANTSAPTTTVTPTTTAAPTTSTSTTLAPTTTVEATTTTLPFDPAEESAAQQRYIDAAAAHQACTDFECIVAQAVYDRTLELKNMTYDINDPIYAEMGAGVQTAWAEWNTCLLTATDRFDCASEESAVNAAVDLLYDALR